MICLNGCKKKLKHSEFVKEAFKAEVHLLRKDLANYANVIDEHCKTITDLTCKYKAEKEKLEKEIEDLKKSSKKAK